MIKKISNIKLDKKQIIIIGVVFIAILLVVFLAIVLGNKKGESKTVEEVNGTKLVAGYANDTEEAIKNNIFQPFEESNITFKVYGEVGWANFNGDKKENISMYKSCENGSDIATDFVGKLSDTPLEVGNHCLISLDNAIDAKYLYHADGTVDDIGSFWLVSYIELPDGSLTSLNSAGRFVTMQVNIYDKETRIILKESSSMSAYFRIAKQQQGKIFTIQVGNKIYKTTGGTELFIYNSQLSFISTDEQEKATSFLKDIDKNSVVLKELKENSNFKSYAYLSGMRTIKGSGYILTRGTSTKTKMEDSEYRFVYYKKNYDDLGTFDYTFASVGGKANQIDSLKSYEGYYGFLKDQKNLNKTQYGFAEIINKKNNNISKTMQSYISAYTEYSLNIIRDYNTAKAKNSVCGNDFLDALDNCGCKVGWYHIKGVGCCPNGYTYNATKDKCIGACPSGTYSVGNGYCCPNGYSLSSDGKVCVSQSSSSSGTKDTKTPEYYPDGKDECYEMGSATAQLFCPNGKARSGISAKAYVSNGKCCIESTIPN